ncbi:SecY-interacting protein [Aliidiomarina sp. Khilg15.8]
MSDVIHHLDELFTRYHDAYAAQHKVPQTDYIDDWDAPCYEGEVRFGEIGWRPVKQQPPLDFSGIENGLQRELHADVCDFYSAYYAGDLHLHYNDCDFTLLQIIHSEDAERLQRNLVAHVLMKDKLKQDTTLFIGTTEASDDLMISVHNQTGVVGLEYAGKEQHQKLANSMAELLAGAQPRVV